MIFVCPHCRGPLSQQHAELRCAACNLAYPLSDGVADFAGGAYYDQFTGQEELTEEHRRGLEAEVAGSRWRIERFYAPKLTRGTRILDCGCGNGVSVDVLNEHGFDAWGIDLSALRKWQWRARVKRDRLAVASALRLPFPDGFFDTVISSGVIEHIGVAEMGGATYTVTPLADRDALRTTFMSELLRVTKPGGTVYLDFPNGAFPIDFWHSRVGGSARWHRRDEGFLPTFANVRGYIREPVQLRALSPRERFAYKQVGRHWYGRLFTWPMTAWFAMLSFAPFRFLARSAMNPYLVIEIKRR